MESTVTSLLKMCFQNFPEWVGPATKAFKTLQWQLVLKFHFKTYNLPDQTPRPHQPGIWSHHQHRTCDQRNRGHARFHRLRSHNVLFQRVRAVLQHGSAIRLEHRNWSSRQPIDGHPWRCFIASVQRRRLLCLCIGSSDEVETSDTFIHGRQGSYHSLFVL